ncbi:hypothetical protein DEJ34_03895 [Curtobacterium sp. MCPF17_050]|uniref:hypothetical protein n=1 Tax=Curtobacterium sp. MCPF17_050 TaxID=2175664 RepID=UPI000D9A1ACE|nr:hypothetical protein [Curtobacterium sp. MCPF17_050]WIB16286.1 hypothetical protein DEJ34_03895 [Curtobacterium sp. MCPF17_050]
MRVILYISQGESPLKFDFDNRDEWLNVQGQIYEIARLGGTGILRIKQGVKDTISVLLNQGTQMWWRESGV